VRDLGVADLDGDGVSEAIVLARTAESRDVLLLVRLPASLNAATGN
jgi:hypothetical protein